MKKVILMAGLVLVSTVCFAQKKNVSAARNMAMAEEGADFDGARAKIEEALANDETKDQANTWYVAGLIGFKQNEKMRMSKYMGQSVDEQLHGKVINESYDYWMHCNELAKRQMIDKKGNPMFNKKTGEPVIDVKMRKQLADNLKDYYQMCDFISYGIYCSDNQDYNGAYENFMRHLNIPDLDMMDAKMKAQMPKDTTYEQYLYYACLFAMQSGRHQEAIANLETAKNNSFEQVSVYQFLYQEYLEVGDTVTAYRVLDQSIDLFPQEKWFLLNRINIYVNAGQYDDAIALLDKAIAMGPEAQYYYSKGTLLSRQEKFDEALALYDYAISLFPDDASLYIGKGYSYEEQANKINEESAYVDGATYKKMRKQMDDLHKKALPLFEKGYELDKDNVDCVRALKSLYYRLGMEDKYNSL